MSIQREQLRRQRRSKKRLKLAPDQEKAPYKGATYIDEPPPKEPLILAKLLKGKKILEKAHAKDPDAAFLPAEERIEKKRQATQSPN